MAKTLEYHIVSGDLGAVRQLEAQGYCLQTGRELQDDRCKDGQEDLQNKWLYVANGNVFYPHPKSGVLSWAYTDGKHNLIIQPQYIGRALKELPSTGIFRSDTPEESWAAINHRSTKRFSLDDLGLVRESNELSFMPIETEKYDALSPVQRKAAETVGFTAKNVAYLAQKGIQRTKIWLPNPEDLARVFEEKGNDPIWRASWLGDFYNYSNFDADVRDISYDGRLRGVRR